MVRPVIRRQHRVLLLAIFFCLAGFGTAVAVAQPSISAISPYSATAGSGAFTLTVDGAGFMLPAALNPISAGSEVHWSVGQGDIRLATTFVSQTRLTAAVPASLITSPGTINITVVNPIFAASNAVTFTIQSSLAIATDSGLSAGEVNLSYSLALGATGGAPPWRWSVTSGKLPDGLNLDASGGALTGMPKTAGTFNFGVQVSDSAQASSNRTFSMTIYPALEIAAAPLPGATVGAGYSLTFAATGGLSPQRWTVRPGAGALPPGLTLDTTSGQLSGTPAAAGTFAFTIQVTDAMQASASRDYSLTVDSGTAIAAVVNAAGFLKGPVAPGALVTLFGTEMGPLNGAVFQLSSAGTVGTGLGGTRVYFDEIPAPVLYAQAGQVTAIVPFGVAGRASSQVTVEVQGNRSRPFSAPVADSAPALFTVNASGKGQAAILNQDYSLNSSLNPASRGSVVMVYATGGGLTDPASIDGTLSATDPLPRLRLSVLATIGGVPAEVRYSGGAPGLVAGVVQLNILVPDGVASGDQVPIQISIGNVLSQPNVTLAVR